MKIIQVYAYEVLNSMGFPTIACVIQTDTGAVGKVLIPTSSLHESKYACKSLVDKDENSYFGYGVKKAVNLINQNTFYFGMCEVLNLKKDSANKLFSNVHQRYTLILL